MNNDRKEYMREYMKEYRKKKPIKEAESKIKYYENKLKKLKGEGEDDRKS